MGKPIDFAAIQRMMDENPDDWYSMEETENRMAAALKKALNVTGPKVEVVDLKGGGFRLDVDFNTIVERGK